MGRNYDVGIITDTWDNYSDKLKITLHQNFIWAKSIVQLNLMSSE